MLLNDGHLMIVHEVVSLGLSSPDILHYFFTWLSIASPAYGSMMIRSSRLWRSFTISDENVHRLSLKSGNKVLVFRLFGLWPLYGLCHEAFAIRNCPGY
jgi:hypothetical protein